MSKTVLEFLKVNLQVLLKTAEHKEVMYGPRCGSGVLLCRMDVVEGVMNKTLIDELSLAQVGRQCFHRPYATQYNIFRTWWSMC